MIIDTRKAIDSLTPGAECTIRGTGSDEVITWHDSKQTQPTTSAINAEKTRLQALEDYQKPRQEQYPAIGDQLDDLYKQGAFSADMAAKLKKVKDDNPKS
tara:strand:+ start:483 stop:782 length:300 start_codon:yes stop_codon:yes gene_type:complete